MLESLHSLQVIVPISRAVQAKILTYVSKWWGHLKELFLFCGKKQNKDISRSFRILTQISKLFVLKGI
jgi:hypothetical protein